VLFRSKTLDKRQLFARCLDCMWSESACVCFECLCEGSHSGHRVVVLQGASGMCDCGDAGAMLPSGFCPRHRGFGARPELALPADARERA
jgi:hypothetical protein